MEQGTLYIVATPIGNMEDITLRALRTLREVDLIAAEDTRQTKKILNAYNITTPLTSLYDQNEEKKSTVLIAKIQSGINIAYVSDAGTPAISDPGYILVKTALTHSITVVPIPGPSALTASLSISGLPTDSFIFYAFLPSRPGKRKQFLQSISTEEKTMICYESPRRLMATLHDIHTIMGDRSVVIFRELTKVYEESIRGTVTAILDTLKERTVKGEITLIIGGAPTKTPSCPSEAIGTLYKKLRGDHSLSTKDIISRIIVETGLPRKDVYREVLEREKNREKPSTQ